MVTRPLRYSSIWLIYLLLHNTNLKSQITVQVQTGTSNISTVGPVYRPSASGTTTNARANILYRQTELSAAGIPAGAIIVSIQFEKLSSSSFTVPVDYKMYMANTPNLTLTAGTTWTSILSSHSLVYENSAFNVPPAVGWISWPIDSFLYTGESLEIADDQTVGGAGGSTGTFSFRATVYTTTSNFIIGKVSGTGIAPEILDMVPETRRSRPNIKITFITPCLAAPPGLMINLITSNAVDFSVAPVNGAVGYEYAVTTDTASPLTGTFNGTNNFHAEGLSPTTTYYVHVRTKCGGGIYSGWTRGSFQTSCPEPVPFVISNLTPRNVIVGWNKMNGITQYEYAVLRHSSPPLNGSGFTTDTILHLSDMINGGKYWLHIRSRCGSKGLSEWKSLEFHPGGLEVFPNPARDKITIKVHGNFVNGTIYIYNALGMVCKKINPANATIDVDISTFATGVYWVKYENFEGFITKIVKL
jgi:hypothetical protein